MEIDEMAERLRLVFRAMKRQITSVSGPDSPTYTETFVLALLDENGPMTSSALSAAQNVRPQTMGQALDGLGARGWIARGPHLTDRRQILISLAPDGRRALARGRRLRQAWLVKEIGRLKPADRRLLSSSITVFERLFQTETETKP
jgi:DNA-binding MarR family transcriptional regulator